MTPLPPWTRWLIQLAPLIIAGLQEGLHYIKVMEDAASSTPDEWRRFVMSFQLAGNVEAADVFTTSMDIVNITGGEIDSSWTQADYDTVAGILALMIQAWCLQAPTALQHFKTDAYRMAFNPIVADPPPGQRPPNPFIKSGPPQYTAPPAASGGKTGVMQVPQVAMTTTDRTAYPRHWGRNYWPMPAPIGIAGDGHIAATVVDAVGLALHDCYLQLMNQEYFPVVCVTRINNAPGRGLLSITEVQVDDVADVVRRRRKKAASHFYRAPVTAMQHTMWTPGGIHDQAADAAAQPPAEDSTPTAA